MIKISGFRVVVGRKHVFSNWIDLHLKLVSARPWHIFLQSHSSIIMAFDSTMARHFTGLDSYVSR